MIIFILALSLSMDAFSLAIIYGIFNKSKRVELYLPSIVGVYHFIMPLVGSYFGNIIINITKIKPNIIISLIFIFIGIQMILEIIKNEEVKSLKSYFEMIMFGFAVSLDSFSAGIGLSYITDKLLISFLSFSFTSALMTYIGLKFGHKIGLKLGKVANIIGSFVLIVIGLMYLFK